MYCPSCGQQHVSGDLSFCTRCGFQLGVVKELLATEGTLPERVAGSGVCQLPPGRKGARLGIKLVFFSIVVLPLFFGLSYIYDSPIPFWVPAITFLAGLTCILYAGVFGEDILPSKQQAPSAFTQRIMNAPPLQSPSATTRGILGAMRMNTAEMICPPSITEHTTKTLRTNVD